MRLAHSGDKAVSATAAVIIVADYLTRVIDAVGSSGSVRSQWIIESDPFPPAVEKTMR